MSDPDRALARIADALERLSPPPEPAPDLAAAEAFVWQVGPDRLVPVDRVARVDIGLLVGVDRARDMLLANTRQFARGFPANNVLLWGARGMGKSSLVKAAHAEAARAAPGRLKLIELHREDLPSIGRLLALLRGSDLRFLLFCDDLSLRQGRQPLQVAEGGARRRHRGAAGQRGALRHLEPPPPDAARDDRERAPDRGEPVRGHRGEGLALATASGSGSASTPARRTTSSR